MSADHPMGPARVWYVNVFVSDFKRAVDFYRDTLGLKLTIEDAQFGYASFATSGAGFAIARVDPDSPQAELIGRHSGIGWVVEDVDATYRALTARGVEFEQTPQQQPWGGYMGIFRDPDNNLFYLDQLREH